MPKPEIPTNLKLEKVKPSTWMVIPSAAWSITIKLTSTVGNWVGLVACRFLLRVTDALSFPGNSTDIRLSRCAEMHDVSLLGDI
jgi:hypothetical protein